MGCCSSRETSLDPASQAEPVNARPSSHAPMTTTAHPPTPTNNVYPPTTASTSSRARLTTTSPHASSTVSSSRPSNAARTSRSTHPSADHPTLPLQRPNPWKSTSRTWTPSQLKKERSDFFDSRVTGQPEVWSALKEVAELVREDNIPTAQGILDALNCTLPTGRLEEGLYDERGNLYTIPNHILGDPTDIARDEDVDGDTVIGDIPDKGIEMEKQKEGIERSSVPLMDSQSMGKGKEVEDEDAIKLKCRLASTGTDCILLLGRAQTVATLIKRLKEEAGISSTTKVRVFYLGREMKEKKTLEVQGYREGHVLNIFAGVAAT